MERIPVHVLYVEDDEAEVELARISVGEACPELEFRFHVVHDGEAAMSFLASDGGFRPDFALLDLNLPRMRGDEVLAGIRRHARWSELPVVVLSGAVPPATKAALERLRVDLLLDKALDLDGYRAVFRRIAAFWKERGR